MFAHVGIGENKDSCENKLIVAVFFAMSEGVGIGENKDSGIRENKDSWVISAQTLASAKGNQQGMSVEGSYKSNCGGK